MVTSIANIRYFYTVPDFIPEDKRVGECSICLESYGEAKKTNWFFWVTRSCLQVCGLTPKTLAVTKCEHVFHKACLKTWLKGSTTCPNCREALKESPSKSLNRYTHQIDDSTYSDYPSYRDSLLAFSMYI